jgi:protein-disulfide isomerase
MRRLAPRRQEFPPSGHVKGFRGCAAALPPRRPGFASSGAQARSNPRFAAARIIESPRRLESAIGFGSEGGAEGQAQEIAMRGNFAACLMGALVLASLVAPMGIATADEFTPAQKQELGAFIRDYLVANPDVLRAAIDALDKRDKQAAEAERQKAVTDRAAALFSSNFQATVGNPKGTATLVEFFDYNCHFCKGALPDVTRLMKDDPNLKLVLKDYPVLGPGSLEAAKVASAARNQLPGDRFWPFHSKLLGMHGPIGKAEALAVARELGLDMDRLAKDMESPEVTAGLEEVMGMADALQINGTPSFVVGQEVVVGAVGYDPLKEKIDAVHKCGHSVC